MLSLCLVLAGTLALPLGLRAVNGALPGAGVRDSYLPSVETPRPREPFDRKPRRPSAKARPEFVVIGDSMAGIRIDPLQLSRLARHERRRAATNRAARSPTGISRFKNLVVNNDLKEPPRRDLLFP